ncbi:putative acyltransferase [Paenibacillus mucilaginosus 3016]|uniref:Putative acyltransferase n=1 Tax=Paenibacillus mucilaginosus 3016 TaxID=1116391 RepID=H6N936_9BACL|nr:acyltransferase [Paenibacillus mucilaginosus]AFC27782.1 putative acyltransferase [Paenibacillus mucilaginosus 3016]WFA16654.1 acyltransferase [Paenibacillus mucilaginosus]
MKKRLHFLQFLRCLAALMVVIHHTDRILLQKYNIEALIYEPFDYPYARVDLFFVLSGFIIYYIHRQDFNRPEKVKTFLLKRFIRLIPLYWVVTMGYLVLLIFAGEQLNAPHILKSFLLLPDTAQPILGVAWTLRYEVFLYLVFCLLLMSRKWFGPWVLVWIASMLILLGVGISFENRPYLDLVLNPLNVEFAAGCLAAHIILHTKRDLTKFSYLGGAILALSLISQEIWTLTLNHVFLWGVPFFFIILGFASYEMKREVSVNKWLVKIGDASYSIFLTHIIVILSFRTVSDKLHLYQKLGHPILLSVFVCIAAVIFGCLFYKFVEKPLLQWIRATLVDRRKSEVTYSESAVPKGTN